MQRELAQLSEEERARLPELVSPDEIAAGLLGLIRDDSLAGRVLVRFADDDAYLLPEDVPH